MQSILHQTALQGLIDICVWEFDQPINEALDQNIFILRLCAFS